MIYSKINGQTAELTCDKVVSDSIKYLKIRFDFNEEWDGYVKTAVFHNESEDATVSVLMVDGEPLYLGENACLVPHEVIKCPGFTVSVAGIKGESVIRVKRRSR